MNGWGGFGIGSITTGNVKETSVKIGEKAGPLGCLSLL